MNIKDFIRNIFSINIYELNIILCLVGFSAYTTFVPESFSSILYRGIALLVSIYCIWSEKSNIHIPQIANIKFFLLILFLLCARVLFEVYIGDISQMPYESTKMQILLMTFGVCLIPTLSVLFTYRYIEWSRTLILLLVILTLMLAIGQFTVNPDLIGSDGRFDLNSRQSTLVFGGNSGMLILVATSCLLGEKDYEFKNIINYIAIAGIVIGILGLAKAGSRGPFVSTLAALVFILSTTSRNIKMMVFMAFIASLFSLGFVLDKLANFAPVLFERMSYTVVDGDTNGRSELADRALQLISDHPLFGTNFYLVSAEAYNSYHNCYLTVAVGLGAILGLAFVFYILKLLYHSIIYRYNMSSIEDFFFLGSLFYFAIRGITGINIVNDAINPIYIIMACIILESYRYNVNKNEF